MSWVDKLKKAGKNVVDAGAKQMLKADIAFLDREIRNRKQQFGVEVYDLMAELENNDTLGVDEKEAKIRSAFDAARKDIAVIQAKKDCKYEEIAVMDAEAGNAATSPMASIPPSSGTVLTNEHPSATSPN